MNIKNIFEQVVELCFEEDYEELKEEILSIESEVKQTEDYETGIKEIYEAIPLYAEDFPPPTLQQIEDLIEDYL